MHSFVKRIIAANFLGYAALGALTVAAIDANVWLHFPQGG